MANELNTISMLGERVLQRVRHEVLGRRCGVAGARGLRHLRDDGIMICVSRAWTPRLFLGL